MPIDMKVATTKEASFLSEGMERNDPLFCILYFIILRCNSKTNRRINCQHSWENPNILMSRDTFEKSTPSNSRVFKIFSPNNNKLQQLRNECSVNENNPKLKPVPNVLQKFSSDLFHLGKQRRPKGKKKRKKKEPRTSGAKGKESV